MSTLLEKLADKLAIKLSEDVKSEPDNKANVNLMEEVLKNGTKVEIEDGNVFVIPEEGEKVPAPVGEHELEDGRILVVEEEGVLKEVKEPEGNSETEAKEEDKKEISMSEMKERLEKVEQAINELAKSKEEYSEQEPEKVEQADQKPEPKPEPKKEEVKASAEDFVEPKKHSPESDVKTKRINLKTDNSKTILENIYSQLNN